MSNLGRELAKLCIHAGGPLLLCLCSTINIGLSKMPSGEARGANKLFSQQFMHDSEITPAYCKNNVGPESGPKDLFKERDHVFQLKGEPLSLSDESKLFNFGNIFLTLFCTVMRRFPHKKANILVNTWPLKSMTKTLRCLMSFFSFSTI